MPSSEEKIFHIFHAKKINRKFGQWIVLLTECSTMKNCILNHSLKSKLKEGIHKKDVKIDKMEKWKGK